jgi:hypothetical protein
MGHTNINSVMAYVRGSRRIARQADDGLDKSLVYHNIRKVAQGVSIEELERAPADMQIGSVVGNRLVAGIGLCASGQPSCAYDPVTSCYGCDKFMPAHNRHAHEEAISGMQEQMTLYEEKGVSETLPAYRQLIKALDRAQTALAALVDLNAAKVCQP